MELKQNNSIDAIGISKNGEVAIVVIDNYYWSSRIGDEVVDIDWHIIAAEVKLKYCIEQILNCSLLNDYSDLPWEMGWCIHYITYGEIPVQGIKSFEYAQQYIEAQGGVLYLATV
jgi:hypothetical protein